jgi:hypothetical protein
MADEQTLRKYLARNGGPGGEADSDADAGDTEDVGGVFGWLRGVRDRAISLELHKRCGDVLAINYGWIERIEFSPSAGIAVYAGGQKIRIKGRNLNAKVRSLFQGISRHRVPWVAETDRPADLKAGQEATVIEEIGW